jgi:NAD+ kinase
MSTALQEEGVFDQTVALYGQHTPEEADVIVVCGGDGLMLETLHRFLRLKKPFYGVHSGTIGFLMNAPSPHLIEQLKKAEPTHIHLLKMKATRVTGERVEAPAINEISLLRSTRQAAKIQILINGVVRLPELICDGLLASTPAGSTAYNLSVGGSVLPLGAPLIALTPISPFRPRRWRGAILPETIQMTWRALEADKRPVIAVADHVEVRDVVTVDILRDPDQSVTVLFDPQHNLEARILNEQFAS